MVTGTAQIEAQEQAAHGHTAQATAPVEGSVITKGAAQAAGTLSTAQSAWLAKMEPYAEQAANATGLTEQLILAQWANETAWGTSYAFTHNNNVAGIGITTAQATGLVSPTLEAGVEAYIKEYNTNPDFEKIKTAGKGLTPTQKTQAQAKALAASPWAAGHYTGGSGLPLSLVTKSIGNVSEVTAGEPTSGTVSTVSTSAVSAAQTAVQTAQKNLTAAEKSGTAAAVATAQSALATAKSNYTTAVQTASTKAQSTATTGATAAANIDAVLKSAGLTGLIGWANELAKTLTAKGLSASAIGTEVVTKMQTTPHSAPIFNEKFPGFTQRVKNGYPAMSITQYLTYQTQAKQAAAALGLDLTTAEIGHLFANNVGATELASGKGTNLVKAIGTTAALKAAWTKALPGFTERVANGYPPLSPTQYVTYVDKAKADATEVGLNLTAREIGSLIAGNVPVTELSTGRGVNLVNVLKRTSGLRDKFTAAFPGYAQRIENGFPAISLTQYRTYETKAKAMAEAAGLPAGFMGGKEVGELIANNVSSSELSTRLTNAYAAAMNVPEATKALLHQYYGITTGHLAAYWLTPDKASNVFKQTLTRVKQEITSAQIGATAKASGFTLGKPEAYATVQKKVTTGTAGNMKVTPLYLAQVGVSQATARETFKSLATLLPLTKALPETGGEKTSLSENDLVNYGFYGTNAAQLANVEQARTAPFRGGGGFVQTSKGVIGAGYGNAQGVESS